MHAIPLGTRVRALRRAKDWTQRALGTRAGINHITISRLEQGPSAHVYAETIVALARALGCTSDYLLGLQEADEEGLVRDFLCRHRKSQQTRASMVPSPWGQGEETP